MVKPIENERTYSNRSGLVAGLRSAGLEALHYDVRETATGRVTATVYVHDEEDRQYVQSKGFTAIVDQERAAT